jgi:ribosomal protein S12 methylthiotransferase accessory factor
LDSVEPCSAAIGAGTSLHRESVAVVPGRRVLAGATGTGDHERIRLIAIAEAAERYSGTDLLGEPTVWARYANLDGRAVDPAAIPRCSATELANPGCRLRPFDPDAAIRWVSGTDLSTGEPVWVPAVMVCYGLRDLTPPERFWFQISTGYAVHTDPVEAIIRGTCEVIERDAIAITWLQRLTLPIVAPSCRSDTLDRLLDWNERHFVETFLFECPPPRTTSVAG